MFASVLHLHADDVLALPSDTAIGEDGLGADSFDLLELARRVGTFFPVSEIGVEDNLLRSPTIGRWTAIVLDAWTRSDRHLTFVTSGSTGTPTRHRHAWHHLAQEIDVFARLFADRRRIVGVLPRHHIYGFLFTVMLPQHTGIAFVDLRERSTASVLRALRPGDLVIGFPLAWSGVAESDLAFAGDVVGVTSTGPCPPELHARLRARGLARLVHVYGSSETAGIGWQDDPDRGFRLLPYWSRGEDRALIRRDDGDAKGDVVLPPDELVWHESAFFVGARHDRAVQVGGINVYLAHVTATIRTHPDVADCAVRLMREEEGHRLKVFVVPRIADEALSAGALQRWIDQRLSPAERPRSFRFGPALPRDERGKLADWS